MGDYALEAPSRHLTVGNSGPVSVQDDSGGQGKAPDKAPKPKGRDK